MDELKVGWSQMSKPSDLLARLVFRLRWTWHTPDVYHLNEGYSALVAVERAAERVRTARESDFFTAHHHIAQSTAFTTHTPVFAGHDRFSADLVGAHLAPYREQIGLSREEFMALGRRDPSDRGRHSA
jgi:glycogen phosphorylase